MALVGDLLGVLLVRKGAPAYVCNWLQRNEDSCAISSEGILGVHLGSYFCG